MPDLRQMMTGVWMFPPLPEDRTWRSPLCVSHLNPLTYVVDALRTFMLAGSTSSFGLSRDYAVILLTTTVMVFIGARLYPRLAS